MAQPEPIVDGDSSASSAPKEGISPSDVAKSSSVAGLRRRLSAIPVPTAAGIFYMGVAVLILVQGGRESDPGVRNLLVLMASVIFGIVAASGVAGWLNLRQLRVERKVQPFVAVGARVEFHYVLANRRLALPAGVVTLRHASSTHLASGVGDAMSVFVAPGGSTRLVLSGVYLRRGKHRLPDFQLESSFPFGLVRHRRSLSLKGSIVVYPRIVRPPSWLERKLSGGASGYGDHQLAQRGREEIFGLREYVAGDPVSRIHWPSTARKGTPMVLELEARQDGAFCVLADCHDYGQRAFTQGGFELLVSMAAGVADAQVRRGFALGLLASTPSARLIVPGRGEGVWHSVMGTLARLSRETRPLEGWAPRLLTGLPRGTTVIVLTFAPAGQAAALVREHGLACVEVPMHGFDIESLVGTLPSRKEGGGRQTSGRYEARMRAVAAPISGAPNRGKASGKGGRVSVPATERAFEWSHRSLQIVTAGVGAHVALGGAGGWIEFALLVVCVGVNLVRVLAGIEKSGPLMLVFWLSLFVAAPVGYLVLRLDAAALDGATGFGRTAPIEPLIVALAIPFQVFAAYVPSIPRAQHLVLSFALVEGILGARSKDLQPATMWVGLLMLLVVLCLLIGHVAAATRNRRLNAVSTADWRRLSTGQFVRPAGVLSLLPGLVLVAVLGAVAFVALPRFDLSGKLPGPSPQGSSDLGRRADGGEDDGLDTRSGEPPRPITAPDRQATSGLPSSVELGSFGPILLDGRLIARVTVTESVLMSDSSPDQPAPPPEHLLLKSAALTDFDGVKWTGDTGARSEGRGWRAIPLKSEPIGRQRYGDASDVLGMTVRVTYAEGQPLGSRPLALPVPYLCKGIWALEGTGSRTVPELVYDNRRDEFAVRGSSAAELDGYEAHVQIPVIPPTLPHEFEDQLIDPRYFAIPDSLRAYIDANWGDKSVFLTRAQSDWGRLLDFTQRWFTARGGFKYSLTERPLGENAIGRFICDPSSRSGHCEYFASAMVVILRYLGVPARMATGYAAEPDPAGAAKGYIIYRKSAHAWVEAVLPGVGWVSVDPTPVARETGTAAVAPPVDVSKPEDDPEVAGESGSGAPKPDPILGFDESQRSRIFDGVTAAVVTAAGWVAVVVEGAFDVLPQALRPPVWARWLLVAGLLALGTHFALAWWRKRSGVRAKVRQGMSGMRGAPAESAGLYRELLELLAQHGFFRTPGQTPLEFAAGVAAARAELASVLDATRLYYRLRFGAAQGAVRDEYRAVLRRLAAVPRVKG